jgi:hypothetical protein
MTHNIKLYQDPILKYPLTEYEYSQLDKVWDFVSIFQKPYIFISDYRKQLIRTVRKKYTIEEFYLLESILNKMFWNLRWLLFPLWYKPNMDRVEYEDFLTAQPSYGDFETIPDTLLMCKKEKYEDENDLIDKLSNNSLFDSTYYRSFINKLIIIDKKDKIIYTKPIEGSSDIFSKNYFNLMTMTILFNKELYEKIMIDPYGVKDQQIEYSSYYYQYDYGFPNLNYCTYWFGTDDDRRDRIQKMYYIGEPLGRYWYKLFK